MNSEIIVFNNYFGVIHVMCKSWAHLLSVHISLRNVHLVRSNDAYLKQGTHQVTRKFRRTAFLILNNDMLNDTKEALRAHLAVFQLIVFFARAL